MKRTTDFLLEVGCEEIPAGLIPRAAEELQRVVEKYLNANGLLEKSEVNVYGGPRRLAAACRGLRAKQPDAREEILGPPKSVAFDSVGAPTRAAESFAAKQGVPVSKLKVVHAQRGECLAVQKLIPGRDAASILAEILPRAVLELSFPRSMTWTGAGGTRFVRPIRWVLATLGGKPLRFELAGVRSGNLSQGHRFLGSPRIPVRGPSDYAARLKRNFVIVDAHERRARIAKSLQQEAARRGLEPALDPALLEQVTYLNEFPGVIAGAFDPDFLALPAEILITVMRDHQKYFGLHRKDGSLAPHFLAVINLDRDPEGLIRQGHERVLRARFADARFFWKVDQRSKLGELLPKLQHVTYETRLGSYAHKVERIRWLSRWFAEQWFSAGITGAHVADADRAAELAKCDLVTEMVREFTELQGIVGGLYAKAQGESEEVAWAVYDQYRPLSLEDPIPRNLTGVILALADKLDSLTGCFSVGLIPSGSSDPFALRRAALGIVKILLERKLPLSLSAAVAAAGKAVSTLPPKVKVTHEVEGQILTFIEERAKYILREQQGFAYDEVNAVFAASADDLVDVARRVAALKAIRGTKNFLPLAIAFKRIRKILEKAGPAESWKLPGVQAGLLSEPAERELSEAAVRIAAESAPLRRAGRYREALEAIAGLRPVVDRFFDKVLVMAQEESIRKNRLTLLAGLLREFSTIADFSEMVPEELRRA